MSNEKWAINFFLSSNCNIFGKIMRMEYVPKSGKEPREKTILQLEIQTTIWWWYKEACLLWLLVTQGYGPSGTRMRRGVSFPPWFGAQNVSSSSSWVGRGEAHFVVQFPQGFLPFLLKNVSSFWEEGLHCICSTTSLTLLEPTVNYNILRIIFNRILTLIHRLFFNVDDSNEKWL